MLIVILLRKEAEEEEEKREDESRDEGKQREMKGKRLERGENREDAATSVILFLSNILICRISVCLFVADILQ